MCLMLTGCFKIGNERYDYTKQEESAPIETYWTIPDVIAYSKGNIIKNNHVESSNSYEVQISDTTYEDYLSYIEALKVTTYSYYDPTGNNTAEYYKMNESSKTASWCGTNGTTYIMIRYYDSESTAYTGTNVIIKVYSSKPDGWV